MSAPFWLTRAVSLPGQPSTPAKALPSNAGAAHLRALESLVKELGGRDSSRPVAVDSLRTIRQLDRKATTKSIEGRAADSGLGLYM